MVEQANESWKSWREFTCRLSGGDAVTPAEFIAAIEEAGIMIPYGCCLVIAINGLPVDNSVGQKSSVASVVNLTEEGLPCYNMGFNTSSDTTEIYEIGKFLGENRHNVTYLDVPVLMPNGTLGNLYFAENIPSEISSMPLEEGILRSSIIENKAGVPVQRLVLVGSVEQIERQRKRIEQFITAKIDEYRALYRQGDSNIMSDLAKWAEMKLDTVAMVRPFQNFHLENIDLYMEALLFVIKSLALAYDGFCKDWKLAGELEALDCEDPKTQLGEAKFATLMRLVNSWKWQVEGYVEKPASIRTFSDYVAAFDRLEI